MGEPSFVAKFLACCFAAIVVGLVLVIRYHIAQAKRREEALWQLEGWLRTYISEEEDLT